MKTSPQLPLSNLGALWAVLWRCLAYTPLMMLMFVLVGGIWLSRWFLPLMIFLYAFAGLWNPAGFSFLAWAVAMLTFRHFRLQRFFEEPPSLL